MRECHVPGMRMSPWIPTNYACIFSLHYVGNCSFRIWWIILSVCSDDRRNLTTHSLYKTPKILIFKIRSLIRWFFRRFVLTLYTHCFQKAYKVNVRVPGHSPVAGVTGSDAVVAPGTSALEGIPAVHDSLSGDTEVSEAVVLLLHARVGHTRNSRPLLRQT